MGPTDCPETSVSTNLRSATSRNSEDLKIESRRRVKLQFVKSEYSKRLCGKWNFHRERRSHLYSDGSL